MTSLSEVYTGEGRSGEHRPDLRRLYVGVSLFLAGALLAIAGIVVATTDVLFTTSTVQGLTDSRHVGGVLGGLGVPAVFLGILIVLPSQRRTRLAAFIGALVAVVGVAMFWTAYPCQWSGSNCGTGLADLTLPTVGVYSLGLLTTFWYLFVGVANFTTRNAPGGTVKMEVTRQGETKVVEVERSGLGSIGFLGSQPDGNVETQTAPSAVGDGGSVEKDSWSTSMFSPSSSSGSTSSAPSTPSSQSSSVGSTDGGSAANDIRSPLDDGAEFLSNPGDDPRPVGDTYCGNCAHFDYVRTEQGIQPYCGLHDGVMDDMDACDQWSRR